MTKKEIIWREILFQVIENRKNKFEQKKIAQKYGFSLSTVFNALNFPRRSGIVEVKGRGFLVHDIEKFLYLWATFRNLKKDIIYQTHVSKKVQAIEGELPSEVILGVFSAFVKKHKEVPADYDKVYVYSEEKAMREIKKRFPPQKGYLNLTIILADPWLKNFGQLTPDCQNFVDLWNVPEWYAKTFWEVLKKKMFF